MVESMSRFPSLIVDTMSLFPNLMVELISRLPSLIVEPMDPVSRPSLFPSRMVVPSPLPSLFPRRIVEPRPLYIVPSLVINSTLLTLKLFQSLVFHKHTIRSRFGFNSALQCRGTFAPSVMYNLMIVSLHRCSSGRELESKLESVRTAPCKLKKSFKGQIPKRWSCWAWNNRKYLTRWRVETINRPGIFLHKDHRKMELMTTPLSCLAASLLRDHCVCLNQRFFVLHYK